MSSKRIIIPCNGLALDSNPLIAGPQGGMRKADNVVISDVGIASLRPSFASYTRKDTTFRPRSMTVYQDQEIVQSYDATSGTLRLENSDDVLCTGSIELTPLNAEIFGLQFVEARKNLYWSTAAGPYKLTAYDATPKVAGMYEAPTGEFSLATGEAMPDDTVRAWRWCFVKRDANGVEVRSAPSPWTSYENTGFGPTSMNWIIPLPSYIEAGDQVELYASYTVPVDTIPWDQMYLSKRQTVDADDLTNGVITIKDDKVNVDLGMELYTNSTREGILKANGRPPASLALTRWQGCLWYGNTIGPWASEIEIVDVAGTTSTAGATGLQRFSTSYTGVSGNTLTGIADTTSIEIGQLATDNGIPGTSGGRIPHTGAFVVSKTADSVLLSATPTGTGNVYFHDKITIESDDWSETWYASSTTAGSGTWKTFGVFVDEERTTRELSRGISRYSPNVFALAFEDPNVNVDKYGIAAKGTLVIRARNLTSPKFTITTTRDVALSHKTDSDGSILVDRDERPNGVQYSKPDQPEHVPEINYISIGEESEYIWALVPLKYALLVFKSDGIWRITGTAPDGWSVDLLDADAHLIRPDCVDVLDDAAYAWTDRGILRVDANGTTNITNGLISRELLSATVSALSPSFHASITAWRPASLLLVSVADSTGAADPIVFCYSAKAGAWSKWDLAISCGAQGTGTSTALYLAEVDKWSLRRNGLVWSEGGVLGRDSLFSLSDGWSYTAPTTATSASITLTPEQLGDWTPKACDWVSADWTGSPYVTWNYSGGTALVVPNGQPDLVNDGSCVVIDLGEEVWATSVTGSLTWTPTVGDTISAIELGSACSTTPEVRRISSVETITSGLRLEIDAPFSWTSQTNRKFSMTAYRRITAVETDASGSSVLTLDRAFPFDAFEECKAYEGIEARLQWQAQTGADPFSTARVSEIQLAMDWSESATVSPDPYVEIGAATNDLATVARTHVPASRTANEPPTKILRLFPPDTTVRASHYFPEMEICALELPWRCLGLDLVIDPVSGRTGR